MPFQPGRLTQGQPNHAFNEVELEWLLCLSSTLEVCKRTADSAETLIQYRVEAMPRPPQRAVGKKSNVA
jgi:hypothetical protein